MRKLLLHAVLFSVIGLSACFNKNVVISEEELTNDIFYYNGSVAPFTGFCEIRYANTGQPKIVMYFKGGKLNGVVRTFYKNGDLKVKGHYRDGLMTGKWEGWHLDGEKAYEVHYERDSLNGEYTVFDEKGMVKEKGMYKMNRKIGQWQGSDVSVRSVKVGGMLAYLL